MKIIVFILTFLLFSSYSYADKEVSPIGIWNTIKLYDNTLQQKATAHKIKQWYKTVEHLPKKQQITHAWVYICKNVEYSRGQHSPYTALRTGKGDCQAYGMLFYLMLTQCEIDSKVIINDVHMWNTVSGKEYDLTKLDYWR